MTIFFKILSSADTHSVAQIQPSAGMLATTRKTDPLAGLPGINDVPFMTNSDIMDIDIVPEHLIIIGGSYIGLEFAQMFKRFGSRVTVVEMAPKVIGREDDDVSAAVQEILENEGIEFKLSSNCIGLARRGDQVAVTASCEPGNEEILGSHILMAVGRKPNTDDLGLDKAGIETDAGGLILYPGLSPSHVNCVTHVSGLKCHLSLG